MKKFLSLSVLIAMFAFISCTEVRDSAGNDENSSATPEKTTYTVTFNSNYETNKSYTQTFVSGESQLLNENCFTRTGYNFAGWNTKRNGYGTSYSDRARLTATCDITLYAQWTYIGNEEEPDPNPNPNPNPDNPVKTYTVTFYSNDETNKSYTQTFVSGQSQNLNVNCFVRNGYTFAGWAVTPNGSVFYTDEEDVLNITTKDKTTMTLYAVWSANNSGLTITLPDSNDAQINLKRIVSEDKAVFSAKSGFDSYGWYIDGVKQSETSATFTIDTSIMNPIIYKIMVIVADGDEYYSATADLEVKWVQ